MFNRNNGITADEAQAEVARLDRRIGAVELELQQARQEGAEALAALRAAGQRELDRLTGTRVRTSDSSRTQEAPRPVAGTTGVDYGAVAYGLASIKADVSGIRDAFVGREEIDKQYRGAVQYFADVFKKADPSFDETTFKVQAGVESGGTSGAYTRQHP